MAESLTVLIVDDEPDVCWALERVLRREGFTVVTAGNGSDALARLRESSFHLILVDAKLADIEGIELARQIRAEMGSAAPMVLVSGYLYSDDSVVQDCLRTGLFSAFVTKPFDHDAVRQAVRKALSTGKTSTSLEPPP